MIVVLVIGFVPPLPENERLEAENTPRKEKETHHDTSKQTTNFWSSMLIFEGVNPQSVGNGMGERFSCGFYMLGSRFF